MLLMLFSFQPLIGVVLVSPAMAVAGGCNGASVAFMSVKRLKLFGFCK